MSTTTEQKITQIKGQLERKRHQQIEQETIRNQIMKQLKERFDVDTIEEAREMQAGLEARIAKRNTRLENELAAFMEKYGEQLND